MDERLWSAAARRDVEQDLTDLVVAFARSQLVEDGADLLIARASKCKLFRNRSHSAIRLCDGATSVVDPCNRRDKAGIDPRSAPNHPAKACPEHVERTQTNSANPDPRKPK